MNIDYRACALAAVLALGSAAGCSDDTARPDKPLIQSRLEAALADEVLPGDPKVTSVRCPSDVQPGKGIAFDCKASGQNGLKGTVRVKLKRENLTSFTYKGRLRGNGITTRVSGIVN